MKIDINCMCDGWCVVVDDKHEFAWFEGDSYDALKYLIETLTPEAEINYEEIY